ncbi:Nucleolin 2, partial [Mucuna pruriens]
MLHVFGRKFSVRSKNQNVVAQSSTEAKFQSTTHGICETNGICEGLWLKIILDNLKIKYAEFIDNYFIKERLDTDLTTIAYVPMGLQLAQALQLNNTELLRCPIRVGLAREKRKYIPNRSFHDNNFRNSFQRSERFQPVKGSEISRDCEQETEEKASKTLQKSPKMLATWQEQNATSKTIYCRNLSYSVVRDDMEIFFEECGEIVDIRLHTDHEGRIKGYGHVEFATTEAAQKALQLNNTVFLGRRIGVGIAHEKKEYTSYRSNWSKSFHQSERTQPIKSTQSSEYCEEEIEGKASESPWESSKRLATLKEQNAQPKTIYVRNLSYSVEPADMYMIRENLFKVCGKIVDIRLHTDHKGRLNGFGKVEFATEEAAKKALEFDNIELLRRPIGVYLAREKGDYTYNRSNWSNSFQRCDRNQSRTIFVKGFNSSLPTEEIKASLEEHFGYCGEIARISVRKSHDFGAIK